MVGAVSRATHGKALRPRDATLRTIAWPRLGRTFACVFIVVAMCLPLVACGLAVECATTIHEEVPSPLGVNNAVVFERDCGATTGFNTMVGIGRSTDSIDDVEVVFSAPLAYKEGVVLVRWEAGNVLVITHPETPEPRISESTIETPDGLIVTIELANP